MEAVRLGFPPDVMQAIRGYASDRVGVHPTADMWGMNVIRFDYPPEQVRWGYFIHTNVSFDELEVWWQGDCALPAATVCSSAQL